MSGIISSILGGSAAPAPVVKPPAEMPTANSAEIQSAKRKTALRAMQRTGRQSTILTGESEKLGG